MNSAVLTFTQVAKSFAIHGRRLQVLENLSFEARRGEMIAIAGPSGAGKTTLLHLAALLDTPDCGQIAIEGRATHSLSEHERARLRATRIGMIFQRFHLLPNRTALDNVVFRFRYAPVPTAEARRCATAMLERVGLIHVAQTPARLLSGGEMQRVAIARALVLPPMLVLADEPTGNLDPDAAEQVIWLLKGARQEGAAVLLATHNPVWLTYCDRVVWLPHAPAS